METLTTKPNHMRKFLFLLATFCLTGWVIAQDSTVTTETPVTTTMEPNQPYYLDIGTQATSSLEKGTATRKTQLKLFGLGGASSMYIIPGAQSTVMIPSADSMTFVINGGKLGISILDKSVQLNLFKLQVEGEERHAVVKEKKGIKSGESSSGEKIGYTTRKEGDLTVMVLSQKPTPGEYAFLSMKSLLMDKIIEVFCFRVE